MYKSFITIPIGIAKIFSINNINSLTVDDSIKHRPDLVLKSIGATSYTNELVNNQMSITSPISMVNGTTYNVMSQLFLSYFKDV